MLKAASRGTGKSVPNYDRTHRLLRIDRQSRNTVAMSMDGWLRRELEGGQTFPAGALRGARGRG